MSEMRTFIDTAGTRWDVWEVRRDHVAGFGLTHHPVAPELENGWLCFSSPGHRRRLASYPDDWRRLSVDQLVSLCARAEGVSSEPSHLDFSRVPPPRPAFEQRADR